MHKTSTQSCAVGVGRGGRDRAGVIRGRDTVGRLYRAGVIGEGGSYERAGLGEASCALGGFFSDARPRCTDVFFSW